MDRLAEIRERADKATTGPWTVDGCEDDPDWGTGWSIVGPAYCEEGAWTQANAEFVAAARSDVPWLVAEVERLQTEAHACCVLLDGAAIEHSGRTLAQRVKNLVVRDDERLHDAITLAGERNRARAEVERLSKIEQAARDVWDDRGEIAYGLVGEPMHTYASVRPELMLTLRAALAEPQSVTNE